MSQFSNNLNSSKASFQNAKVFWLTGLPCSGKSTLANALTETLRITGLKVEQLDGDAVRKFYPKLGFSKEERNLHIMQMALLASVLEKNGITVVASFVSPYEESRKFVREHCENFIEIYVSTALHECEKRDVKGMYKKARSGEISSFTGVDDPYEVPVSPELAIDTLGRSVENCIEEIVNYLQVRTMI